MEQFIKNLAWGAGAILRKGFRSEIEVNHKKGHWDVVTQYDFAADKFIQDRIKKKYRHHSILSEETGGKTTARHLWIIDPLDGTRNFSRGIPLFCTIIAYAKNGVLEQAAIYDPMHDELFHAAKGHGSFLNGRRITVNAAETLEYALGSIIWNENESTDAEAKQLQNFARKQKIWNTPIASSGLNQSYVACGRFDFEMNLKSFPWDYAAGALIAKEAGARVTQLDGKEHQITSRSTLTANPKLHSRILKALKR